LVFAVSAGPAAASDETGTVRGRVLDQAGRPLASATVLIVGTDAAARCMEDGSYLLVGVAAGRHTVEARAAGFSIQTREGIAVAAGEVTDLDFGLVALEVPVKEVVVTSSVSILQEQSASSLSLDRRQITELPHFGDDPYRAIAVLPGTSGGDVSARFNVRGGFHDELLVRIDHLELFEPFHLKDFQGVFSVLDPEMIGAVDLVPGGFTAEYGDRMTGVLDMSTRTPSEVRFGLGISFTNAWFNTGGTFADGRGRWLGSLRRGYLDVILGMTEDEEGGEQPPDPRYWDGFGMLGFDLSRGHSVALQALVADDTLLFEESEPDERTAAETGYGSHYLWLRHQGVVGAGSFANTALSAGRVTTRRDIAYEELDGDERLELHDDRELTLYGLRTDWHHELSDRNYLRWGLELRSYDADYDYRNDSRIGDPIDDPRFEPGIRIYAFDGSYRGEWYAAYVTDRIRLGSRLTAELGLRYDGITLTDEDLISPRVNLLYNVSDHGVLRLGWGHFYQSQRPYELAVQFDETEFHPSQRAEHWVVGFEGPIGRGLMLRVDGYLRDIEDPLPRWETLFDPFQPAPEYATDLVRLAPRSATGRGVELFLASRRGERFDWWVTYVWSSIEDLIEIDTPRYVDQTHAVAVSVSWRPSRKWSLTGVWSYHTGWPTTAVSAQLVPAPGGELDLSYDVGPFYQERLDDYHRLDVRASRTSRLGKGRFTVFIDIQNLYDRGNERGLEIADPEYRYDQNTGTYDVSFPRTDWLSIIPSFGVSYEF
jgi:hypothetical protein